MVNKYTVKEKVTNLIIVEKSKFYGVIFQINSKEEFINELENIKKEYPKATHYCYAYLLENEVKCSDNGEPSGTAGKPILKILEANNLKNVALVVIRYFGGTLLGAGRLTRTYSEAAQEAFKKATLLKIVPKKKVRVSLDIDIYNDFLAYLNKMHYITLKTLFNDKIIIDFVADQNFESKSLDFFLKKVEVIGEVLIDYLEESYD